jgi:Ca2+-binding EF-hand superfamily protein
VILSLNDYFCEIDADGSGEIDATELAEAMAKIEVIISFLLLSNLSYSDLD